VIIVFIGKLSAAKTMLIAMRKLHIGNVAHKVLSACKFSQTRSAYIDSLSPAGCEHTVHFIVNPQSACELEALRNKGAVVCHEYGALSSVYNEVVIECGDLMVSALSECPNPAVILAPEILSECVIKHRKNKSGE